MYIDATVGDRRYGGYEEEQFEIEVTASPSRQVTVRFKFGESQQQGGSIEIGPNVANWISYAVLAASNGYAKKLPLKAHVVGDEIKLPTKPKETRTDFIGI